MEVDAYNSASYSDRIAEMLLEYGIGFRPKGM